MASAAVSEPDIGRVPRQQSGRPGGRTAKPKETEERRLSGGEARFSNKKPAPGKGENEHRVTAKSKDFEERRTSGEDASVSRRKPASSRGDNWSRATAKSGATSISPPVEPNSTVVSEGEPEHTVPTASTIRKQGFDGGSSPVDLPEAGVDATRVALKAWLSSTNLEPTSSKRSPKQRTAWNPGSSRQPLRTSRKAGTSSETPPLENKFSVRKSLGTGVDWELSQRLETDAQTLKQSGRESNPREGFWRRLERLGTRGSPAAGESQSLLDVHSYSAEDTRNEVYEKLEALAQKDAERRGGLTIHLGMGRWVCVPFLDQSIQSGLSKLLGGQSETRNLL